MTQQEERVKALTDKLEQGVKDLFESGRYQEYLRAMSRFHRYSFGNTLLIWLQCPAATHVAGFTTWKRLGRSVKKGTKGIRILAPCPQRCLVPREVTDPNTGEFLRKPDGTAKTETSLVSFVRFKAATVFDLSQTEGRELPSLGVARLTGDVEQFEQLYQKLTELSPVPVEQDAVPGNANGYFSAQENRIVLRSGMSQMQTIKTLIHELAHARLHDRRAIPKGEQKDRRQKEVEAESVAYVVCQHLGLDTGEYSFGYVAGWSKGKELMELKASLATIQSAANEIISALEEPEKEKAAEKTQNSESKHPKEPQR